MKTKMKKKNHNNYNRFLLLLLIVVVASAALILSPLSPPPSDDFLEGEVEEEVEGFVDPVAAPVPPPPSEIVARVKVGGLGARSVTKAVVVDGSPRARTCATVEEMGMAIKESSSVEESLRVRKLIRRHFDLHGAVHVRRLPPDQFCRQGFILGKGSEAGFGNDMYKILSAAALSVMLNRSLIIGKSSDKLPFKDYISYTNLSFTLQEVKHLWQMYKCVEKYGRRLTVRIDDFNKPSETGVLCGDWRRWKHPIIWFQGTTDAIASQFFLKNIHPRMRFAAAALFGQPDNIQSRANTFGELMRLLISPSEAIKEAINWSLKGGADPDFAIHMRMMSSRSGRALHAALSCINKSMHHYNSQITRPRIVLVSDTPSFVKDMTPYLSKFSEVIHFNYQSFQGKLHEIGLRGQHQLLFRVRDWGPAPRWVAIVDFFLASRAKYAVISGANRRVGTTYAQLIAAFASADHLGEGGTFTNSTFSLFSSFQSTLLANGLARQVGWGHAWNRFAGPLSCRNQAHQCAITPLVPPAWWDGDWQSPIPRDIRRLRDYGVQLTSTGQVSYKSLYSYCKSKKTKVRTLVLDPLCKNTRCV